MCLSTRGCMMSAHTQAGLSLMGQKVTQYWHTRQAGAGPTRGGWERNESARRQRWGLKGLDDNRSWATLRLQCVISLSLLPFEVLPRHLRRLDSSQDSGLKKKRCSSLPLQTHGCPTGFKCHLHVDVIHRAFSYSCLHTTLEMNLNKPEKCEIQSVICCAGFQASFCVIVSTSALACHQQCDLFTVSHWLKPDPDNVSFPAHILRERSLCLPPAEKLQGAAIKASTSTTYWIFSVLSSPFSPGKMLTIGSIFVYCNQSWMHLSTAFCCPCADKLRVEKSNRLSFSDALSLV